MPHMSQWLKRPWFLLLSASSLAVRRLDTGDFEVMDDMEVITFDLVHQPSVKEAVLMPVTRAVMMPEDYQSHRDQATSRAVDVH